MANGLPAYGLAAAAAAGKYEAEGWRLRKDGSRFWASVVIDAIVTRVILVSGHARAQLPPLPAGIEFLPKPYRVSQLIGLLDRPGC